MQNPKKSIFFLIPSLSGGGAERVIVTLLKHLDRSKFNLTLAVVNMIEAVYRDDLPFDVELVNLNVSKVRYALPQIIALIWKRKPDVAFSTLGHLNVALSLVRPLLPNMVCYIARETIVVSDNLNFYSCPKVWAMLYRKFYKRFDFLVCQSHDMKADLVDNFSFPPDRAVIINNPVNMERIKKLANAQFEYSRLYDGGIRLVAVGRLTKQKGFDLLIDAIALLCNPKIHLCILGKGELLDELERRALERGIENQVEFVGFQANPYAWLTQADAFVLSSYFEGFPNVVLEALACGTPVISTPAPGGIYEILNGVNGCVIAGEISAIALAEAISQWLSGPRLRIPEQVVLPYCVEKIVAHYERLFLSAAPK